MCRGRILIAIKTEISESIDTAPSEVEVEPTHTINEVRAGIFSSNTGSQLFLMPTIYFFQPEDLVSSVADPESGFGMILSGSWISDSRLARLFVRFS
jgi:hypothetical protein